VGQSDAALVQPSYAWLLDVLTTGPAGATWARAGQLPEGYELADQFALVPAIAGRSLLVSLRSRSGAAAALTSFNALRPVRSRLLRRVVATGLRTGAAQLLPGKIDIGTARRGTSDRPGGVLLSEYVGSIFGSDPVVMAVSGGEGPQRKPVLQVFSTGGKPLGFVKVGWNAWTRDAVRRDAAGLRACAASGSRLVGTPELIGLFTWHGLELLATAPLPSRLRRIAVSSPLPDVRLLREISMIAGHRRCELAASPWWHDLRTRIVAIADPAARATLDAAARRIEQAGGRTELEFGTWHGDFVPWNLARAGQRLLAWDWESGAPAAPLGFDALHYYFQVAFVARRLPLADAAQAARKAAPALSELGVPAAAHDLVAALHLLELSVSHLAARGNDDAGNDRFYPAVTQVLDRLTSSAPDAGQLSSSGRLA
jgi:hypothetical protein